jgi:PAS domain S-box-containing protein
VTELSGYVLSMLREGDFTLYRGSGDGLAPILLVTAEDTSLKCLERLEREYALKADLDADWAAQPVALSYHSGRLALVLNDPGGEPLDRLFSRPLEIEEFLCIAVPLASAIRRVHERGLIHKDIKPANVLVDVDSGRVWLTGFGIASRLPRERQNSEPPERIAGTLAYMAPEQTGRMNRSIDARSDLYALGVTFYEMLTGALPFAASDPMELIHCHIARQAIPPSELVVAIPAQLSAIVMKLLAKTPEERYQTAAGVEADLRRCLLAWHSFGKIDPFQLGTEDASDRLMIPERLYGRESEIDTLLAAFDRVVVHGTLEVMLVSGYSGIGKSSVVNELHKVLVPPRGLFASGKFDQYKRDVPYATLAQAFRSLVRPMLGQSELELSRWRDGLREALGIHGALIVNLVPELELVIGEQPPVPDLPPQETQKRFQTMVRRFVAVFARKEHPLALFLDDLQWIDTATLDLLEHLITHPEVRHLLLIGAYRDNEVRRFDPLMRSLDAIRKCKANVCEAVLAPLILDDVERLIADSLHCGRECARPLADLVQEKTAGNPFFVIQFISALAEQGLIAFDRNTAAWKWDLARIRGKGFTDNVVDLMIGKLSSLPDGSQNALKLLAALGNSAESATLTMVQVELEGPIGPNMWEAVRAGLVLHLDDKYAFLHDRVQEAAYSLIPADQRAAIHLRIGRCLIVAMSNEILTERIFDVANHFNRAVAVISDPDEIERVAHINLRAARKAKASTAYASACRYLSTGVALIGPSGWATRYDLAFELTLELAECTFLSGRFDEAEELVVELIRRTTSKVHKAAAYRLKIELHVVRSENPKAVDSALDCLRLFGIDMPVHPSAQEVHLEYEKIWRNLGDRSIEGLIDLPRTAEPEHHAAMRVLAALIAPASFVDPNLYELQICQMVNLTLKHGMTDASTHGYAWFGCNLCYGFHRYEEGYRFGKLALDLVEKRSFIVDRAQVYYACGVIFSWMKPHVTSTALFEKAFRICIETGDLSFAVYSATQIINRLILTGTNLEEVWRESEKFLDFARNKGFRDGVDLIVSQQRFVTAMQGRPERLSTFNDAEIDEATFEAELTADRMSTMVCWYWILKIGARFLSGEYGQALEAVEKAKQLMWANPAGEIQVFDYHFYSALTLASAEAAVPPERRGEWRARISVHQKQLREWSRIGPENFGSAAALVEAEAARIDNRALDAEQLYENAIRLAHEYGLLQNEGVANELAARFYAARGFEKIARAYLRDARQCYFRWGAERKVRQLEQLHPHLREKPIAAFSTTTFGAATEQFDLGTVIKASQALSGEIDLGNLIDVLMRIAIEHAGANRGLLVLPRGDELRIEAEATVDCDRIEVFKRAVEVTTSELPISIIQYVARTEESVILDDALVHNSFSTDHYIAAKRCRSVLCLPLLRQAKLIGILYLENRLASHVFTPARASLLAQLASQAAISLENAHLYADLHKAEKSVRQTEAEFRLVIDAIPALAWSALPEGVNDFVNKGWVEYTNLSLEDTKGFGWSAVIHPDDLAAHYNRWRAAVATGQAFEGETRLRRADGQYRWFLIRGIPLRDELGNIIKWYGTCTDIEDSKRAEAKIRQAESELRRVVDTIPALAWSAVPDGSVDFVYQSWVNFSGLSLEATKGDGWATVVHPDDLATHWDRWRTAVATGEFFEDEARFRRVDGQYRWHLVRAVPWRDELGNIVKWYGTQTDIEDRKQAELERHEAAMESARLASIVASSEDAIISKDLDGRIISWNAGATSIFGYSADEMIGQSISRIIPPELHAEGKEIIAHLKRGERIYNFETVRVASDGRRIDMSVTISPLRDKSGNVIGASKIGRDISERKRAAKIHLSLQTELARVARLTTMGELTASIAHEIIQPLSAIVTNGNTALHWLQDKTIDLHKARSAALRAVRDAERANNIIRRIRALMTKSPTQKVVIDMNDIVGEVLALIEHEQQKRQVLVCTQLAATLPPICGDRVQLQQLMLNLVVNGIEAMVDGTRKQLTIETRAEGTDHVLVLVRDSGVGLDLERIDQIFDPFFTTKPEGTGMGLAICRSIVEAHEGRIWASAGIPHGAVFHFALPTNTVGYS